MSTVSQEIAKKQGSSAIAERTRRHITRRLAPFLFILYSSTTWTA
jgi:hypothetical protein